MAMTPKLQRLHDRLTHVLGERVVSLVERLGELTLEVRAADYLAVAQTLRDHPELRFAQLIDLCGLDYSTYGDRPWPRSCFRSSTTAACACACSARTTACRSSTR
jgi:NADH-quinone oxidoreductase subunit C